MTPVKALEEIQVLAETIQEHLDSLDVETRYVEEEGPRVAHTTHEAIADELAGNLDMQAIRRTFASMLGELEVDGEVLDAIMGHKAKSVRGRHYMGISFERMARALERLVLVLPNRPGVCSPESSCELSQAPEPANDATPTDTLQHTGTTGDSSQRRRVASWRGPRSSKPV